MGPGQQGRLRFEDPSLVEQILIFVVYTWIRFRGTGGRMMRLVSALVKQGNTTVRNLRGIETSWRRVAAVATVFRLVTRFLTKVDKERRRIPVSNAWVARLSTVTDKLRPWPLRAA